MQRQKRLRQLVLMGLAAAGMNALLFGSGSYAEAAETAAQDAQNNITGIAVDENGLHIDQVGYLTGHEKTAMVSENSADSPDNTFSLIDAKTNQVAYTGELSAAKKDAMSEETLRRADFSKFNQPGTYRLQVGSRTSSVFAIDDNVYAIPAVDTFRSYTLTRSGTPIDDDEVTGLNVKMGHPQDKEAVVYFTDKVSKKGQKVDVSGGWYDAGDYGKYTTTGSLAAAELLLAYEANPTHFTEGQLLFPKGIQYDAKLPDVLNEAKYELDFLQKMQRKDGSTFHKVAGAQWPGFDKSPDTDTQTRYLYSTCSASTAMYGASLAVGARVYQNFDPGYAKSLLKNADKVWAYLMRTPKPVYRVDEGQESGSGPYNDTDDSQERLWMAAEMYRTTGDAKYEKYLLQHRADFVKDPGFFTWDNPLALGQFAYAMSKGANPDFQKEVKDVYLKKADDIVNKINHDGFECALSEDEYTWASNKNAMTQGDMLLMAYQLEPKQAYLEGALSQIHYIFGRNSLDKSFLTGVGANPPEHPHNRIHESTGAYIPGLLVGGPNHISGGDPDQTKYLASKHVPVAKSYIDVLMSWSTNEYAIDYTGSAAYALSWFAKPENLTASQIKLTRSFPKAAQ